jgi:hypothetical protein
MVDDDGARHDYVKHLIHRLLRIVCFVEPLLERFFLENGALYGDLHGHIYYCKRLLGSTNLSNFLCNSMHSGPFASTHTSKVAHSPCAPAPLSTVQELCAIILARRSRR